MVLMERRQIVKMKIGLLLYRFQILNYVSLQKIVNALFILCAQKNILLCVFSAFPFQPTGRKPSSNQFPNWPSIWVPFWSESPQNERFHFYMLFINFFPLNSCINQLKISDNDTMFWNICPQSGICYPTIIPIVIPTPTNLQEPSPLIPSKPDFISQPPKIKSPLLHLTEKDLMRAGYQNKKRPWGEGEDQKLKHLRDNEKLDWADISRQIPGRNPKMCYNRYRRLENHTKNLWKKAENEKLCQLVDELGENWKEISRHFERRTHKQIKEHYINFLRPEIKKDDWTLEQDVKLIKFLNTYGKNWKYLEQNFQGRTQNQIKNRYFGRLKKIAEKKVGVEEQSQEADQDS